MNQPNPDNVTPLPLSDKDQRDLESLAAEPSADKVMPFFTILKVWLELLKPAAAQARDRVEPQWASRICSMYPQLVFADMIEYRARFFAKIEALRLILEDEVGTDDECLTYTTPEEDREYNSQHYKNILTDWQIEVLDWELEWDTSDPSAAAELAAISEVHKMFFGDTGLVAHLDNIKFEFTDDDRQALAKALEESRLGR
jgi:hypothetical protein